MNSSQALPSDPAPRQSSIIAHPWFPKLIGLWFAALFGLCSLALAPELLERIVTTLGIDRIVPAAAPPLGQTARLLLALGMAGVGEIAGLVLGARLAAGHRSEPVRRRRLKSAAPETGESDDAPQLRGRDRHPDAPARKPLSVITDLGSDPGENQGGIDTALRRRALASEAEHEPRPFFEVAPLPGGEWQPVAAEETQEMPQAAPKISPEASFVVERSEPDEVFDLGQFDAPSGDEPAAPPAPFAAPSIVRSETFVAAFIADEPAMPPLAATVQASAMPTGIATASLEELGVVQLSERLALALRARRERRAQPLAAVVLPLTVVPIVDAAVEEADLAEPVAIAALDEPLLPEPFAAQEESLTPPALPDALVPAPFAARPLFAPLAGDDADEDHDIPALARSLTMPRLGRTGPAEVEATPEPTSPELARGLEILARRAPKAVFETDAPVEDRKSPDEAFEPEVLTSSDESGEDTEELTDEILEEGYSSLLAIGSGFQRPEAFRIEEPQSDEIEPVVIFPGQGARAASEAPNPLGGSPNARFARPGTAAVGSDAPPTGEPASQADPEETDRALRAALASLQRISGAR